MLVNDIKENLHSLVSKLFKSRNGNLPDEDIKDFLSLYLKRNTENVDNCLQLFRHLIHWYRIDVIKPLILSVVFKNFKDIRESQYLLEFLTELIYNVDPKTKLLCLFEITSVEENSLNFPLSTTKALHKDLIRDLTVDLWEENPSLFWFGAVVLLHTR